MKKIETIVKATVLTILLVGMGLLLPEAIGESRESSYIYDENSIHQDCVVEVSAADDVYICTGPQSKRYHKMRSCKGLSKCSKQIIKISVEEATDDYGRTPCGYCYGR